MYISTDGQVKKWNLWKKCPPLKKQENYYDTKEDILTLLLPIHKSWYEDNLIHVLQKQLVKYKYSTE